jgi:hypothetical protein
MRRNVRCTRRAQATQPGADHTHTLNTHLFEGYAPTDGTEAAQKDERKFRYFLVSAAALGQVAVLALKN